MNSSGHHYMSGIYNIGHCVMPWWISNCEQGSGSLLVFFYRHSTRKYLMKEKQGGPIPTGLKRCPLKLIQSLFKTGSTTGTCVMFFLVLGAFLYAY